MTDRLSDVVIRLVLTDHPPANVELLSKHAGVKWKKEIDV